MPQGFYEIASTAAENIQIPRMGIVPEILLDLKRQSCPMRHEPER